MFYSTGYIDTKRIEPLPGMRVLNTQTRKAGTIELSYASMTTYLDDGVEYTGYTLAITKRTYHQSCVGQDTLQGKL